MPNISNSYSNKFNQCNAYATLCIQIFLRYAFPRVSMNHSFSFSPLAPLPFFPFFPFFLRHTTVASCAVFFFLSAGGVCHPIQLILDLVLKPPRLITSMIDGWPHSDLLLPSISNRSHFSRISSCVIYIYWHPINSQSIHLSTSLWTLEHLSCRRCWLHA